MNKTLITLTLVLFGCSSNEVVIEEELNPKEALASYSTYENDTYALVYPSEWDLKEERQGTGGPATGIRTDFSNMVVDSPFCPDEMIFISLDTAYWYDTDFLIGPSFDAMVKSDWAYAGMEPELGKWSGELLKTTIGGKEAYQIDSLGWETGCDSKDYVVSTTEGHYMTIEVSAGATAVNGELVQEMLGSIQFKK